MKKFLKNYGFRLCGPYSTGNAAGDDADEHKDNERVVFQKLFHKISSNIVLEFTSLFYYAHLANKTQFML